MTISELKAALQKEHKRDVKVTLIGYAVVVIGILFLVGVVLSLIYYSGNSFSSVFSDSFGSLDTSNTHPYYLYIVPCFFLIMFGYFIFGWVKLFRRPQEIDKFVHYIENGKRVTHLSNVKLYKVKIPLYFVNYHTAAVQMFYITLEGVNKTFVLPVPRNSVDMVKDLLNENS